MSKLKKELQAKKDRFISTMSEVAHLVSKPEYAISRDEYIRISVDTDIADRLNKEDLHALGGFTKLKKDCFPNTEIVQPKVLIFDIETSPILGYVWQLFDQNVALEQIKEDWHVLSWSAKWLNNPEIMYDDQRNEKDISNDKRLLKGIWKLLDEADVVVTQNGKKFDVKKLNARFILNGFKPPRSYKHIDTLQIAKSKFGFTSNKLAYLSSKLNVEFKKQDHAEFSGFKLWAECLKGNKAAFESMEKYNKYDVLSLEELFKILSPWDNGIDFNIYHEADVNVCKCGNSVFKKSGFHYTQKGKFQKFQCTKCGCELRGTKDLHSDAKKKSLMVKL
jgi:DNA polymerase elongation subunit (family B)